MTFSCNNTDFLNVDVNDKLFFIGLYRIYCLLELGAIVTLFDFTTRQPLLPRYCMFHIRYGVFVIRYGVFVVSFIDC